jgi:hypothetical protein
MGEDAVVRPGGFGGFINGPGDGVSQGLAHDGSTGFADGSQHGMCPFTRTALPHLCDQKRVRQHDEVHVPGLALALTQLTVSPAQMLLAVPMKGFRARPALAVDVEDATDLPVDPVVTIILGFAEKLVF